MSIDMIITNYSSSIYHWPFTMSHVDELQWHTCSKWQTNRPQARQSFRIWHLS